MKIQTQYFKTPFGELILGAYGNQLCLCDWVYRKQRTIIDNRLRKKLNVDFEEKECDVLKETKIQLNQYFNKKRKEFNIPLLMIGTDFQKQVWNELRTINYGTTISYKDLSNKLQNLKAIRAVASANGANALSIIIPCHRIIGSNGNLIGYAGGIMVKKKLLTLEEFFLKNQYSLDF